MGFNTVVVALNDMTDRWPVEVRHAMSATYPSLRSPADACFGWGAVVSVSHADDPQVVVVGRNSGRRLMPHHAADEADLKALVDVLLGHGYFVRAPGRKRGEGPYCWGWYAQEQEKQNADLDLPGDEGRPL